MGAYQSTETTKKILHDYHAVAVMAEKSEEITDKSDSIEILTTGNICPNCRFSRLTREGSQVFCPICGYGMRKCS